MKELIEKAKLGDKEAFTELVLLIKDDLYRISKIRLKNDEDVYDAIQETMIHAFKSIKGLKKIEYFKTWIIRILINECNQIYRRKNKHQEICFEEVQNNIYSENNQIDEKLNFEFICNNLEYEDKLIVVLYYKEQYTDKEIGEILKLNENTVRTKRNRAKEKIKRVLKGGY